MGLRGDKEGSGLDENIRIQKGGRVITRMQGFKKNNTISEKELDRSPYFEMDNSNAIKCFCSAVFAVKR